MRIIGGDARGRRLKPPPGQLARPTSDRVRQSLFDVLGQRCDDLRVLDLFAGTGALGLEALSRGARAATFIEKEVRMLEVLRANVAHLGLEARSEVLRGDALNHRTLEGLPHPFDLVLADPPYAQGPASVCEAVGQVVDLVVEGGRLVVEHDRRMALEDAYGPLLRVDSRRYGDTVLSFFERQKKMQTQAQSEGE